MKIIRVSTVPISIIGYKDHFEYLIEQGIELILVTSPEDQFEELKKIKNIRVIPLKIKREISLISDFISFLKLSFLFLKERPDIVHSNTPKASIVTALAGFFSRVPFCMHTFTGQRWITLKGRKRKLLRYLDNLVVMLNHKCLADSPSQAEFLNKNLSSKKRVICLGAGSFGGVAQKPLRLEEIKKMRDEKRRELEQKEDDFIFLFVGRVCLDKGIVELLEAFKEVRSKNNKIKLLIVGPYENTDQEIEEKYEKILLSSNQGIHYDGFSNTPEKFYPASDCLVLPSFREGFGTVILEAAIYNTPSIGSNIYGLSDAIVNEETGLLFEKGNILDLIDKMNFISKENERRIKMGKSAAIRARRDFSIEKVGNDLVEFYREAYKGNLV